MNSFLGSLPKHQYVWVDSSFTHKKAKGFVPAVWFGLTSHPSRMWGCNCLFEDGAMIRNLPLHALANRPDPVADWTRKDAQEWDCYGIDWSAHEYTYLRGLSCQARCADIDLLGDYLFTVAPVNDAFSEAPEQSKEFTFVRLHQNGRYTVQPSNRVLFQDVSFTHHQFQWPKDIKTQKAIYSCEK